MNKGNNNISMEARVKSMLNIFDKVGIASKGSFENIAFENHPSILMPNFESAIVFAQGSSVDSDVMGVFEDYFGTIAAQNDVIDYLDTKGYSAVMVEGTNQNVSLVRMGIEAGVGEISPVDSLIVKGLGLTASLGAILTNAPLIADERVRNICVNCMKCLKVCPIREIPNAEGDLTKCGCGKCRYICPV